MQQCDIIIYHGKTFAVLLCYDAVVIIIRLDRMSSCYNLRCSWWILLNFEQSDPWHWIKVIIDIGYIVTLPVYKQEALRFKNGCSYYLYTKSLFFICFWWVFFIINSWEKSYNLLHQAKYYIHTCCNIH